MTSDYILTLHCPDRPGILASVTGSLVDAGGDVRDATSFGDESTGEFFIRLHCRLGSSDAIVAFERDVACMATRLGVRYEFHPCAYKPKVLILVSKADHCLVDLLHRHKTGALHAQIPMVIANHDDLRGLVEWHGIEFLHLAVNKSTHAQAERQILELIAAHQIDLTVLARYMQILSADMCDALKGRCINIHHSFLPSFKGAKPYHQAYHRWVKLIGATAHYVTGDLDEGPIIEQEVRRVDHATSASEMVAIGREIESSVLARAVRWHLEHRVLMNGNKTVVFA